MNNIEEYLKMSHIYYNWYKATNIISNMCCFIAFVALITQESINSSLFNVILTILGCWFVVPMLVGFLTTLITVNIVGELVDKIPEEELKKIEDHYYDQ